ncbi:glycosyltransferase family 2 protein [Thomasclavelia sp.]
MISIIVPIFNMSKYLSKCIESILAQSYSNFELILIDDGSTDDSLDICKKYAELDSRIIVLKKTNGGQGSARNLGLERAKGEFITFVDSDDWIEKKLLETLLNNLKKYDADISCCGVYSKLDKSDFISDSEVIVKNNFQAMELFVMNKNGFNHSPVSKIFKRELFRNVKFLELRGFEDTATIFKTFIKAKTVVSQPISLYFYLQRNDSTMHREFSEKDYDRIIAYKEMESGLSADKRYISIIHHVTASKIGAIYYVVGELMRSNIKNKNNIIKACIDESVSTLKSEYDISKKNKLLLRLLCISPILFGYLYEKRH